RDHEAAGGEPAPVGQDDLEAQVAVGRGGGGAGGDDLGGHDEPAVLAHLGAPALEVLGGRGALIAEQRVDALGRGVGRGTGVEHDDAAPGAGQHERAAEAGSAAADDGDVDQVLRQRVAVFDGGRRCGRRGDGNGGRGRDSGGGSHGGS